MRAVIVLVVCALVLVAMRGAAKDPAPEPLQKGLKDTVQPFLTTYCVSCHGGEKPKGDVNLSGYQDLDAVAKDWRRWEAVLEQIEAGRMPPAKAQEQPTAEARRAVAAWIGAVRKHEAKRTAGDPGRVPPRRLSNAEYDNTIRDLTGVDIRPAKEFPVDPANEAGFDNSAESLAMSPALVNKYLEAARRVSEHVLFLPDRLAFAEYGVIADTDRDKFGVRQIIAFYQRQRTDYSDYFQAAWRLRHKAALGQANLTAADVAKSAGISAKYLSTIWNVLRAPAEERGPIAALRLMWEDLPKADGDADAVRAGAVAMRDFVMKLRQQLVPDVKNLMAPRPMNNGSQPLVMWKNREMAANRMRYAGGGLKLKLTELMLSPAVATCLEAPADPEHAQKFEATFPAYCATFPDAFYVSERARIYLNPAGEKKLGGRLLSAGFHSMTGYFRDDGPLYELMLNADEQKELDRLWLEFDVITGAPMRTHTSFIWFERTDSSFMRGAEFDIARAEDKDSTSEAKIKQLAEVYLGKVKSSGASAIAQKAVQDHFEFTSTSVRRVETTRRAAEPKHVANLQDFAERAFRRPLTTAERDNVAAFYRALRDKEDLGHEDAVRDTLVSILISPHFLFHLETSPPATTDKTEADVLPAPTGTGVQALSDYALASRLSYFLWSSMPDAELLAHAKAGDLHRPDVLIAQVKRMTKDDKIRALATEFAGNWLDFRRFEEHNAVDRERFSSFNDDLRRAMFEEPVRFVVDAVRSDRSVLDLVYGQHTFVNPVLAKHYGMTDVNGSPNAWQRIDDARPYGRGGLLPMAVFLTKNAPGLRTSPVKRGYWVVRRVLGEKIPAPPADVPELPSDEAKLGDKSLRDLLALHRADKACSGCHERFDSVGLAFEGYGPIGESRTKDLGDRPVDAHATFPGGHEGDGLDGLRAYLKSNRQNDFVDNLCRKLLAFGLGRTLLPGDDDLIEGMRKNLEGKDYRFSAVIEPLVASSQFMNLKR